MANLQVANAVSTTAQTLKDRMAIAVHLPYRLTRWVLGRRIRLNGLLWALVTFRCPLQKVEWTGTYTLAGLPMPVKSV